MKEKEKQSIYALTLAALGVVYGDIGTSPLYAVRESLGDLPINVIDVLGVLSMIFWALILVISIKYLVVILRANNDGEGGILALQALIKRANNDRELKIFFLIGVFGAGLMLGDGMLTPAISVMSAVEGLSVLNPSLSTWVVPITALILVIIFSFQSHGTKRIGFAFGPIVLIWFIVIGWLGVVSIIKNPVVLHAVNPHYAYSFLMENKLHGYILMGGVFLVVTGGEALYADLGHFGTRPIRLGWFLIALPGLMLNYFGQAAFLLQHPTGIKNPFYMMAPEWFTLPLLVLATLATIIASQAVITATFSLTKQAVLLGLYPHLPIIQTSEFERGQIYIPQMNFILALGTMALVFFFQNSTGLTHAYGIAVNLVMLMTTPMIAYAIYKIWRWNIVFVILLFSIFMTIDLLFFGANSHKITTGGWVPIAFASICAFIMYTWNRGMQYLRQSYFTKKEDLAKILKQLKYKAMNRLPNMTAIFITDVNDKSGGSVLTLLKLSLTLPENVLIVSYVVENIPHVKSANRFEVTFLDEKICQLILHYGFMDFISIPTALFHANDRKILPFSVDVDTATYLVEMPTVTASKNYKTLRFYWEEKLFAFLMRNYSSNLNIEFYQLPTNRTIAIGTYCVI